jgi:hypothetical protein
LRALHVIGSGAVCNDIQQFRARVLVIHAQGFADEELWRSGTSFSPPASIRVNRLFRRSHLETVAPGRSGQRLAIMRPLRLMGMCRMPPIGSPPPGAAARRPRAPSGLLEPLPLCRNRSRPASVRGTPNAEAPGCVPRHRTRRVAGLSGRCPGSGERATGVFMKRLVKLPTQFERAIPVLGHTSSERARSLQPAKGEHANESLRRRRQAHSSSLVSAR